MSNRVSFYAMKSSVEKRVEARAMRVPAILQVLGQASSVQRTRDGSSFITYRAKVLDVAPEFNDRAHLAKDEWIRIRIFSDCPMAAEVATASGNPFKAKGQFFCAAWIQVDSLDYTYLDDVLDKESGEIVTVEKSCRQGKVRGCGWGTSVDAASKVLMDLTEELKAEKKAGAQATAPAPAQV